jgi:ferredoxin-NADP reductase/Na+-translocating ferredoxin:NAD+ oxidoreductase RnfD subunit
MRKLYHRLNALVDGVTMYRIMLYTLGGIILWSFSMSALGILGRAWYELGASLVVVVLTSLLSHLLFARLTRAPANIESSLITALILFLILSPGIDVKTLILNALVSMIAIASKYVLVYRLRHVFNPVAIALVFAGVLGYIGVEWWVASRYMFPAVIIAALIVVMKTDHWKLVFTYIGVSTLIALALFTNTGTFMDALALHFLSWPTIFFAAFMLTEPLGLPSTRRLRYAYAVIVAVLGTVPFAIGPVHGTPELALVAANLFTVFANRPARYALSFRRRIEVGPNTFEYYFASSYPVAHSAGQYLEWTLPHSEADSRGIRRYLTIVTPPNAQEVGFAIKHVPNQSSWKRTLETLKPGATMYATGLAGDFTLPKKQTPTVFIAGGIGITPFMSMIRSKIAQNERIDATLFLCSNTVEERSFSTELEAARAHGLTTVYVTAAKDAKLPDQPYEEAGFVTVDMLSKRMPEWRTATFYISGPPGMVAAYAHLLSDQKIPSSRIITDYFPGLA